MRRRWLEINQTVPVPPLITTHAQGPKGNVHETAIISGDPQHFVGFEENKGVLISSLAKVGPYTTVDGGTEKMTTVKGHAQIMGHCNIGHDATVGEFAQIADSVVIAGHAEVGDFARIGIGALVLPYRKVGMYARVGAGAVVTKDVPAYECWAGNPARWLYDFCKNGCWMCVDYAAPHGRCPACQMSPVGSASGMRGAVAPHVEFCKGCTAALAHDEADICDKCAWDSRG